VRANDPWPPEHRPDGAAVFAHNELEMKASPEAVWAWIVRADRWSEFYGNAKRVRIVSGEEPELQLGTKFKWVTFNSPVTSTIVACVPGSHLAWEFAAPGMRGYHYWQLEPTDDGCRVVTEETQRGLAAWLLSPFMRSQLARQHQRWLEGLERVALGDRP
jgi:hypothetical protein